MYSRHLSKNLQIMLDLCDLHRFVGVFWDIREFLSSFVNTVDGRNPAPVDMVNIMLFTFIYRVSYIPGFLPSTVPKSMGENLPPWLSPVPFHPFWMTSLEFFQTAYASVTNTWWSDFHVHKLLSLGCRGSMAYASGGNRYVQHMIKLL